MAERQMDTWAWVEAYLDGDLDPRQVEAFERALSAPEVALELSRALALRRLLHEAPIEGPSPALVARLQGVVVREARVLAEEVQAEDQAEADVVLTRWLWATSAQGLSAGREGAALGWRALGFAFAPLQGAPPLEVDPKPAPSSLWRRALRRAPAARPTLLRRAWGQTWRRLTRRPS
ncbi:hypothetical protein KJ940_18790 [Myxococcota bacterium]|nr:hypothetical protein [Myxococcota bacterium]